MSFRKAFKYPLAFIHFACVTVFSTQLSVLMTDPAQASASKEGGLRFHAAS